MSGLAEKIHQIVDEERIKTMSEIDRERQETLLYLTQERQTATEDFSGWVSRVLEALSTERMTTLTELEAMGNRISEQTIVDSKQLIDHFFIRLLEFALVLFFLAGIAAFFFFRLRSRGKIQS